MASHRSPLATDGEKELMRTRALYVLVLHLLKCCKGAIGIGRLHLKTHPRVCARVKSGSTLLWDRGELAPQVVEQKGDPDRSAASASFD
jgi:hypothetical protein